MVDPETIYHWYRLDDRITTSGQPTETELADIAAVFEELFERNGWDDSGGMAFTITSPDS
jgi:hypothetical protein